MASRRVAWAAFLVGTPGTSAFAAWQGLSLAAMVALLALLTVAFIAGGAVLVAAGPDAGGRHPMMLTNTLAERVAQRMRRDGYGCDASDVNCAYHDGWLVDEALGSAILQEFEELGIEPGPDSSGEESS